MNIKLSQCFLLAGLVLATVGCGNLFDVANPDTADTASVAPRNSCDQLCRDNLLAFAVEDAIWFLHNQNIAGGSTGYQNRHIACGNAASADITGTVTLANNDIQTVHLVYQLNDCYATGDRYALTLSGTVFQDGTFRSGDTSTNAVTIRSDTLRYRGSLGASAAITAVGECPINISDDGESASGLICGRRFSY